MLLTSNVRRAVFCALLAGLVFGHRSTFGQPQPTEHASNDSQTELDPKVFTSVPHRSQGIPDTEKGAYYRVLKYVRDVDYETQKAAADRQLEQRRSEIPELRDNPQRPLALFIDIMRYPERYQGKPVTLEGILQRVVELPAEQNPFGLQTLYEARLVTADASGNPTIVISTSIPDGLPLDEHIRQRATVTGYVFKICAYTADGQARFAPLLIAQTFEWQPRDTSDPSVVDPEVLAVVRNRTMGVRDAERDAYYRILKLAADGDYRRQKAAARKHLKQRRAEIPRLSRNPDIEFPTFVDVFKNPERHLGKPVTMKGHIFKLISFPAGRNDYCIETLYEAWLFTDDSQRHPAVIVCTTIPDGMPIGNQLVDHVETTGYMFKLYGYAAEDGATRLAPLILAQRLEWHPPAESSVSGTLWAALYALIAVFVLATVWLLHRTAIKDRAFRNSLVEQQPESCNDWPEFE